MLSQMRAEDQGSRVMDDTSGRVLIVMWDREGLDSVVDATQLDQDNIWNILSDNGQTVDKVDSVLMRLRFRARFNSHRCCEIYAINVDEAITGDDIGDWFEVNPQGAADLIRSRGTRLLSQRTQEARVVIS